MKRKLYSNSYNTSNDSNNDSDNCANRASLISAERSTRSIGVQAINKATIFSQTSLPDDQFTCTSSVSSFRPSTSNESKSPSITDDSLRFDLNKYRSSSSCTFSSFTTDNDIDEEEKEEDEDEDEEDDHANSHRPDFDRRHNYPLFPNKIISKILEKYYNQQAELERYYREFSNYKLLKLCMSGNGYVAQPGMIRCHRVVPKFYNKIAYRPPDYTFGTTKNFFYKDSEALRSGGINNRPITAPAYYSKRRRDSYDKINNIRKIYVPSNNSRVPNLVRKRYYIVGSRVEIKRFKKSQENFSNFTPRKIIKNCSKHCVHCLFGHDIDRNAIKSENGDSYTDHTDRNWSSTDDSELDFRRCCGKPVRKIENTRNCVVCSKNTRLSGGNNDGESNYLSPVKSAIIRLKHFSEKIDTQEKIMKSLEKIGSSVNYRLAKDQESLKSSRRSKITTLSVSKLRKKSKRNVHPKQTEVKKKRIKEKVKCRRCSVHVHSRPKLLCLFQPKSPTEDANVIICEQKGKPNNYQSEKNTQAEIKNKSKTEESDYAYARKESFYSRKESLDVEIENEKDCFVPRASFGSYTKRIRGGDSKFLQNSKYSSSKEKDSKSSGSLKNRLINNFSVFCHDYTKTCTNETCEQLNSPSSLLDNNDFEIGFDDESKSIPIDDKINPNLSEIFHKSHTGKNYSYCSNTNIPWHKNKKKTESKTSVKSRTRMRSVDRVHSKKQLPTFVDYRQQKNTRSKSCNCPSSKLDDILDDEFIENDKEFDTVSFHEPSKSSKTFVPQTRPVSENSKRLRPRNVFDKGFVNKFKEIIQNRHQSQSPDRYFQTSRSNLGSQKSIPRKNVFSGLLVPPNPRNQCKNKPSSQKLYLAPRKSYNAYEQFCTNPEKHKTCSKNYDRSFKDNKSIQYEQHEASESRYDRGVYEVNMLKNNNEWNFSWKEPDYRKPNNSNRRKSNDGNSRKYEKSRSIQADERLKYGSKKSQQNIRLIPERTSNNSRLHTYEKYLMTLKNEDREMYERLKARDEENFHACSEYRNNKDKLYKNLKSNQPSKEQVAYKSTTPVRNIKYYIKIDPEKSYNSSRSKSKTRVNYTGGPCYDLPKREKYHDPQNRYREKSPYKNTKTSEEYWRDDERFVNEFNRNNCQIFKNYLQDHKLNPRDNLIIGEIKRTKSCDSKLRLPSGNNRKNQTCFHYGRCASSRNSIFGNKVCDDRTYRPENNERHSNVNMLCCYDDESDDCDDMSDDCDDLSEYLRQIRRYSKIADKKHKQLKKQKKQYQKCFEKCEAKLIKTTYVNDDCKKDKKKKKSRCSLKKKESRSNSDICQDVEYEPCYPCNRPVVKQVQSKKTEPISCTVCDKCKKTKRKKKSKDKDDAYQSQSKIVYTVSISSSESSCSSTSQYVRAMHKLRYKTKRKPSRSRRSTSADDCAPQIVCRRPSTVDECPPQIICRRPSAVDECPPEIICRRPSTVNDRPNHSSSLKKPDRYDPDDYCCYERSDLCKKKSKNKCKRDKSSDKDRYSSAPDCYYEKKPKKKKSRSRRESIDSDSITSICDQKFTYGKRRVSLTEKCKTKERPAKHKYSDTSIREPKYSSRYFTLECEPCPPEKTRTKHDNCEVCPNIKNQTCQSLKNRRPKKDCYIGPDDCISQTSISPPVCEPKNPPIRLVCEDVSMLQSPRDSDMYKEVFENVCKNDTCVNRCMEPKQMNSTGTFLLDCCVEKPQSSSPCTLQCYPKPHKSKKKKKTKKKKEDLPVCVPIDCCISPSSNSIDAKNSNDTICSDLIGCRNKSKSKKVQKIKKKGSKTSLDSRCSVITQESYDNKTRVKSKHKYMRSTAGDESENDQNKLKTETSGTENKDVCLKKNSSIYGTTPNNLQKREPIKCFHKNDTKNPEEPSRESNVVLSFFSDKRTYGGASNTSINDKEKIDNPKSITFKSTKTNTQQFPDPSDTTSVTFVIQQSTKCQSCLPIPNLDLKQKKSRTKKTNSKSSQYEPHREQYKIKPMPSNLSTISWDSNPSNQYPEQRSSTPKQNQKLPDDETDELIFGAPAAPNNNFSQFFGICDYNTCRHYGVEKVILDDMSVKDDSALIQTFPIWFDQSEDKKNQTNHPIAIPHHKKELPIQFKTRHTETTPDSFYQKTTSTNFDKLEDGDNFRPTSLSSRTSSCSSVSQPSQYSYNNLGSDSIHILQDDTPERKRPTSDQIPDRLKIEPNGSIKRKDSKTTLLSLDMLLEKCGHPNERDDNKMYDFNIKITKSSEMKKSRSDDSALSVRVKKFTPVRAAYHATVNEQEKSNCFNSVHSLKINKEIWQKNSKTKTDSPKELSIYNNNIDKLIVFASDQSQTAANLSQSQSMLDKNLNVGRGGPQQGPDPRCEYDNSLFDYFVTDVNQTTSNDSLFGA